MPIELWFLTSTKNALPRSTREPIGWMWGPLVISSNWRCDCLPKKWSFTTRINESFHRSYPVVAWMSGLLWKAKVTASSWHLEADLTILFFVLKAVSVEPEKITMSSGWKYGFVLPVRVLSVQNSIKANIEMVNKRDWYCTSHLHARTQLPSVFSCKACTFSLALICYHTCLAKGMYQL